MKVFEVFSSIDGEINGFFGIGQYATFIRLAGCNLTCPYCDVADAQRTEKSSDYTPEQLYDVVVTGIRKVTITGGEPLLQTGEVQELISLLEQQEICTTIETNGTQPLLLKRQSLFTRYVVDWKLDYPPMDDVLTNLTSLDVLKIVIQLGSQWSFFLRLFPIILKRTKAHIAVCAVNDGSKEAILLDARSLYHGLLPNTEWERNLNRLSLNVQLHKLLGVD